MDFLWRRNDCPNNGSTVSTKNDWFHKKAESEVILPETATITLTDKKIGKYRQKSIHADIRLQNSDRANFSSGQAWPSWNPSKSAYVELYYFNFTRINSINFSLYCSLTILIINRLFWFLLQSWLEIRRFNVSYKVSYQVVRLFDRHRMSSWKWGYNIYILVIVAQLQTDSSQVRGLIHFHSKYIINPAATGRNMFHLPRGFKISKNLNAKIFSEKSFSYSQYFNSLLQKFVERVKISICCRSN